MIQIDKWAGLVTNASPYAIPPGATVEQVNIQCLVPGQLTVRPGMQPVTMPQAVPAGATIIKAFRYQHGSDEHLVYQTSDGEIYSTQIAAQSPAPGAAPSPPTIVAARAGENSIHLSVTPPSSTGGSAITGYVFQVSSDNKATWVGASSSASASTVVTGLTAGIGYYVRAAAANKYGLGDYSGAYGTITPSPAVIVAPPGAPTNVTAVAGNAVATVRWTAPASTGNAPITSYAVSLSDDRGATWTSVGTTSSLTIEATSLRNETEYLFRVAATNSAGQGAFSAPSAAVTPSSGTNTPSAPTNVSASATQTSITLTWSAPSSNGGSAVASYTVGYKLSTDTSWTSATATSPYTITDLSAGTAYDVRVAAVNLNGTGPYTTVAVTTPSVAGATVPGSPVGLAADVSDTAYTLTWSAPASNGGAAISAYKVERSSSSAGPWTTEYEGPALFFGKSITLTATAFFRVSAKNSVGYGQTASVSASVRQPPGAPTGVTVTPSDTSALVSWTRPSSLGTPALSSYVVRVLNSFGNLVSEQSVSDPTTSYRMTGLSPSTSYTAVVRAQNSYAFTDSSSVSFATIAQNALPLQPTLQASVSGTMVTATATLDPAESASTYSKLDLGQWFLILEYSDNAGASFIRPTRVGGSGRSGSDYVFAWDAAVAIPSGQSTVSLILRVSFESAFGHETLSPYGYTAPFTVTRQPMSPPTSVRVAYEGPTNKRVMYWLPPSTGGSIGSYRAKEVIPFLVHGGETVTVLAPSNTSYTASGYGSTLSVATADAGGVLSSYAAATEPTPSQVPAAPTDLVLTPTADGFTATWKAGVSGGLVVGAPLQRYKLSTSTTSDSGPWTQQTYTLNNPALSATITGFSSSQTIYVKVEGVNSVGTGTAATGSLTTTPPADAPGPPTNLQIVSRTQTSTAVNASLDWDAPLNNGTTGITRYEIQTANSTTLNWSTVFTTPVASPGLAPTAANCDLGRTKTPGIIIRVRAINASGPGQWSDVITERLLPSPTQLVPSVSGTTVDLRWRAPAVDATYETLSAYVVQSDASGSWQTIKTILRPPPTFLQPSPPLSAFARLAEQKSGTSYRVAGVGSVSGQGAFAETMPVTFDQPPSGMAMPSVSRDNNYSSEVTLSWKPPFYDGGLPLLGYILQVATVLDGQYYDWEFTWKPLPVGIGNNGRVSASTLSISTNLPSNQGLFAVRVVAVNSGGEGASEAQKIYLPPPGSFWDY